MFGKEKATIEEIESAIDFIFINRDLIIKSIPINADFSEDLVDGLYEAFTNFYRLQNYKGYTAVRVREIVIRIYHELFDLHHK